MKKINYPIPKKMSCPITKDNLKKKSKYKNKKVLIDGIWFDSQKEGNRYLYLKQLERAKIVSDLKMQVSYEIGAGIKYIADFVYKENNEIIVEDVKGFKTDVYKLKKKLFEFQYKIKIKEV